MVKRSSNLMHHKIDYYVLLTALPHENVRASVDLGDLDPEEELALVDVLVGEAAVQDHLLRRVTNYKMKSI